MKQDLVENILAFSDPPSIRVGPLPVLWLPSEVEVPRAEIDRVLSDDEKRRAREIRAHARREEYERVRWLLRKATGWSAPLPRRQTGAPTWPDGYVGSITHKDGLVALTMGRKSEWTGLGLDCEDVGRVRAEFEERLATETESALLSRLEDESGMPRTKLLAGLFAYKEALFKCHFPLGERMFWFLDARIVEWRHEGEEKIIGEVLIDTSPKTPKGHRTEGRIQYRAVGEKTYALAAAWLKAD